MTTQTLATAQWRDLVPAVVAAEADQWKLQVHQSIRTAVLVTGQALRAMKPQMPHGAFEAWWRNELGLKDRKLVSDLMAASELLEESPDDTLLSDLPARTLAILSRGGPAAVVEAAQRLERGERLTEAKARRIAADELVEEPTHVVEEPPPPPTPDPDPLLTREGCEQRMADGMEDLGQVWSMLYRSTVSNMADLDKPHLRYTVSAFCEQASRHARMNAIDAVAAPLLQEKEVLERFEEDLSPEQAQRHKELWMLTTPLLCEYMFLEDQCAWFTEHVLPTMEDDSPSMEALMTFRAEANAAVDDAIEAAIAKAREELPPEEFQAAMEQLGRVA